MRLILFILPYVLGAETLTESLSQKILAAQFSPVALLQEQEKFLFIPLDQSVIVRFSAAWFEKNDKKNDFAPDLEKIDISQPKEHRNFRGILPFGNKLAIFDAATMGLRILDRKKLTFIGDSSIPWDRLKPARDRIGEPTKAETAKFRQKMQREFQSKKILGASKSKSGEFFILTTMSSSLLSIKCPDDDPLTCYVERGCKINVKNPVSMTTLENRLEIATKDKIYSFKFHNCDSILLEKTTLVSLPPFSMLRTKDYLYLATKEPSKDSDASLFRFKNP